MKAGTKRMLISAAALVLVAGALAGTKAAQFGSMMEAGASFAPPPESVTSAEVEAARWQPELTSVGTLTAKHSVTLSAELPGTVERIGFESGQSVRAGEVLAQLDTSIERAQLASAMAEASLAEINHQRTASLRKLKTVTQADLDVAETRAKQTQATVASIRATIAKKNIRAPFDGRLGMRTVDLGQMLSPGAPIVTVTDFDPIYVDFHLPQQALSQLAIDQVVRIDTDAFSGRTWEGKITAIDSRVDVATRNVMVRAELANEDEKLRPGMFVDVRVILPEAKGVVIVPGTAIIYAPYGDSVFVIEEEKGEDGKPARMVARQKFVRTGERRGDMVAIESGLEAGATVVSAGAFKLRNGATVVVNNELAPDAKVAPNPSDS